jgi:hypothetical protein
MRTTTWLAICALTALTVGATAAPPTVADFSWLSGQWCRTAGGEFIEEHWLAPRGDLMLGISRTIRAGKTTSFEFVRVEVGTTTSYIAQPQGRPPPIFRLTASGANWARFENSAHDFPQRIEYRRMPNGLLAEIAGPGKDGKENVIPIDYAACPR